jgi:hypothetical protein
LCLWPIPAPFLLDTRHCMVLDVRNAPYATSGRPKCPSQCRCTPPRWRPGLFSVLPGRWARPSWLDSAQVGFESRRLPGIGRPVGWDDLIQPDSEQFRTVPRTQGAVAGTLDPSSGDAPRRTRGRRERDHGCTPIRQAPRSWQYRASVSHKISRLLRICLIRGRFETGRTIGLMLRRNRLTGSPGVHHRGSGWQPDGEVVAVASGQPVAS